MRNRCVCMCVCVMWGKGGSEGEKVIVNGVCRIKWLGVVGRCEGERLL